MTPLLSVQFDMKNRKLFLKRSKAENIKLADLYIGSTVNVLSRQLSFVDYGDDYTRNKLSKQTERYATLCPTIGFVNYSLYELFFRTLALIKPDAVDKKGAIIEQICRSNLYITQLKMCSLSRDLTQSFYAEHQHKPFFK